MTKPIARDWFETISISDGVTLIRELHVARWLRCNIWHVRARDRDILIDAGMGLRPLKPEIARLSDHPLTAIASHCHFDHMGGSHEFDIRLGHPLEAHVHARPSRDNTAVGTFVRAETFTAYPHERFEPETFEVRAAPLTGHLDEGDVVDLGDRHFQVFHLPGHSPGSIALYEAATGVLFSGDVVYNGYLFDTVYHSDPEAYVASLNRLKELPVSAVHAGHNRSFGREKMISIIDEFLSGGRRMADLNAWINAHSA